MNADQRTKALEHLDAAKTILRPIGGFTELSSGIRQAAAVAFIDAALAMASA